MAIERMPVTCPIGDPTQSGFSVQFHQFIYNCFQVVGLTKYYVETSLWCKILTGGRTYFDDSRLVCLILVHKPMVCDRLKFKTSRSNGQNEQVL